MSYYILLSSRDVLSSAKELKDIGKSPIKELFKKSKLMFLLPFSQAAVAIFYRAIAFSYVAVQIMIIMLRLKRYSNIAKFFTFGASSMVGTYTRFMPSFASYLEPFKKSDGSYDLNMYTENLLNETKSNLKFKDELLMILSSLPLALIRGVGTAFILHGIINKRLNDFEYNGELKIFVSLSGSLIPSSLIILHAFLTKYKYELYAKAKLYINVNDVNNPVKIYSQDGSSDPSSYIALLATFVINCGSQASRIFLAIASISLLVGPYIGAKEAAILGLMIGAECAWVNFQYVQEKIYRRNKELLDNTKCFIYSCKSKWEQLPSFWTHRKSSLETRNLLSGSAEIIDKKTLVNTPKFGL